ncbi:hypothetical protein CDL15_Pgr015095 [Punica granatum]|uniref:Uncharacterized protein n=1 Tax=Punica granatum TaxID=22663 RepID=A0A218X0H1_PUNGR|nr:hypothetical protein CDL15_Pgr015095 [Punica granatum]PKI37474.1 hypothetical protein CRG98_042136 [Punica granatum]
MFSSSSQPLGYPQAQSLALAAIFLSTAMLFLALPRHRKCRALPSCLRSAGTKKKNKRKNVVKRVRFADNVIVTELQKVMIDGDKEENINSKNYRRRSSRKTKPDNSNSSPEVRGGSGSRTDQNCRSMPANRVVVWDSVMVRDHVDRLGQCVF